MKANILVYLLCAQRRVKCLAHSELSVVYVLFNLFSSSGRKLVLFHFTNE